MSNEISCWSKSLVQVLESIFELLRTAEGQCAELQPAVNLHQTVTTWQLNHDTDTESNTTSLLIM